MPLQSDPELRRGAFKARCAGHPLRRLPRTNQERIMADCEAIEGKGTFHH